RDLGPDPAQDRAHGRVRRARRAPDAGDGAAVARVGARRPLRRQRRVPPDVRRRATRVADRRRDRRPRCGGRRAPVAEAWCSVESAEPRAGMSRAAALALDLDGVLGDTRPLWRAWLESAAPVLGVDPDALPEDRARAADELDRSDAGNWRTLLERFSEDRAPVYLRRDPG